MAKLSAGIINTYEYYISSSSDDWYSGGVNNVNTYEATKMVLFNLYPVEGLNIGVAYKPDEKAVAASDFDVNVLYTMAGLGTVVAKLDLGADAAASAYSATAKFTGVENLSVAAGYVHTATDTASVFGIVGYTAGPLYLEVSPSYDLDASSIYAELWAKYKVSDALSVLALGQYRTDPTAVQNEVFGGVQLYYTVSAKGSIQTGVVYGDVVGVPNTCKSNANWGATPIVEWRTGE